MEQTRKYNKDLDKDLCKAEPSITIQIIKKDDFFSQSGKNMAKQRQARLSKADINKIVDQAISETLEKEADKGLCKAYCKYLVECLDTFFNQTIEMIDELKQQALTDKQIERLDYMAAMQASLHKWVKCKILSAYYDEVLNVDTDTGLYLAECEGPDK